jgi:hypothetical protein
LSDMAKNTIQSVDQRVDNCMEGTQAGISEGNLDVVLPIPDTGDLLEALLNTPHNGPDFAAEAKARADAEMRRETRENERAIVLLNESADKLEKDADALEREADEEADAEKEAEAERKRAQAKAMRKEANCRGTYGKSCAEVEKDQKDAAKKPPPKPDQPGGGMGDEDTGGQLDGVNYSSCASLKAAWLRFKAECERRGSWDRAGSECNEFIRRENGCVSTWIINPHPDGDHTCVRGSFSKAQLQRLSCEEQQKIMSPAEVLEGNCGVTARPPIRWETNWADVCNDPSARPTPEANCGKPAQSTQFPGTPTGGGPKPQPHPYGDFMVTKGAIVFDALRLGGLGSPSAAQGSETTRR